MAMRGSLLNCTRKINEFKHILWSLQFWLQQRASISAVSVSTNWYLWWIVLPPPPHLGNFISSALVKKTLFPFHIIGFIIYLPNYIFITPMVRKIEWQSQVIIINVLDKRMRKVLCAVAGMSRFRYPHQSHHRQARILFMRILSLFFWIEMSIH